MLYLMQQMTSGRLIIQDHKEQGYKVLFNTKTGAFVRVENEGVDEPFWSKDGPELIDLSITNYCNRECNFCYRQSNVNGTHMSMADIENIVLQAKEVGVLQIALGGGNPNQHPKFIELLKLIKSYGIVPSYTTNGMGLTDDILKATADYCGAMAISLYPPYRIEHYSSLVDRITSFGIRLNMHVILKEDTVDLITSWLQKSPHFFSKLNAIIILNYKPLGKDYDYSVKNKTKLKHFFEVANECKSVKIGFDSCSISGIVKWMKNVKAEFLEFCEAARFSAFISEDMKMYPCSFMVNTDMYGDLRKMPLKKIWQESNTFKSFRENMLVSTCNDCVFDNICNGGCRYLPEINVCNEGRYSK